MVTWSDFASAAPAMAERGFEQLSIPVAYLATIKKDGSPRLHPLSPIFAGGRLFVAIQASSPRRFDLSRDGRYSLHALPPMLSEHYDEFEFNVTGRTCRITDAETKALVDDAERARGRPRVSGDDHWLFEMDIEHALTTTWSHTMIKTEHGWFPSLAGDQPKPTRRTWKARS